MVEYIEEITVCNEQIFNDKESHTITMRFYDGYAISTNNLYGMSYPTLFQVQSTDWMQKEITEYCGDGRNGTFFKDSEAYENDWDAPCYSEEACFDDAATTDRYWTHVSLLLECGYNEKLCNAMFSELAWQCPDTWLNELDEEDYSYYWSWLKVGCKAFWWLDEWWDADFYEVVRIGDAPEDYNPDTTVWLRKPDEENPGKYEEIEARLWELAEIDISRQLQKKKEEYYHSFIKPGAKVWWSDPAGESSDWFYVDSIEGDGYPWGDETEVWLKMNKNDKVATNQVLMQELSITNK